MYRLKMDWFSVGEMTVSEIKTCLRINEKIREADNYELHHVIFTANANARGGDKRGKPIQLYEKEKTKMSYEDAKKEMELLGVK